MSAKFPGMVQGYHILAYSLYVEAELLNFKSQNILCAEAELQVTAYSRCGISVWFLVQWFERHGSIGPQTPGSKPSFRYYLLAEAHTEILFFVFSVIIKQKRISCVMTGIHTLDKYHAHRPLELSYLQG